MWFSIYSVYETVNGGKENKIKASVPCIKILLFPILSQENLPSLTITFP